MNRKTTIKNMKKTLFFATILVALFSNAMAQTNFPNADFENWENSQKPEFWSTSIDATIMTFIPVGANFALKTTDAHSGNYAMEIRAKEISIPEMGALTVPAIIQLGATSSFNIDQDMIDMMSSGEFDFEDFDPSVFAGLIAPGEDMTEIPSAVKGWYKFLPDDATDDAFSVIVTAFQWDETLNARTPVAVGEVAIDQATNEYQEFLIPMEMLGDDTECDSITAIIMLPATSLTTTLYIDDLSLEFGPTSINETETQFFQVSPNPASTQIEISPALPNENYQITIYDMNGKKVLETIQQSDKSSLNIEHLQDGLYLVEMTQNSKKYHSKLIVK